MDRSKTCAGPGNARIGRLAEDDAPLTEIGILAAAANEGDVQATRLLEEDGLNKSLLVVEALKHSWQDLAFHVELRMVHMRFFLLVIGALIAGFAQAYSTRYYGFAFIASSAGCIVAVAFFLLDVRDSQSARRSSAAVQPLQWVISSWLHIDAFRITGRKYPASLLERTLGVVLAPFRAIFHPIRVLLILGFLLALVGTFASWKAVQSKLCPFDPTSAWPIERKICDIPISPHFAKMVSQLVPAEQPLEVDATVRWPDTTAQTPRRAESQSANKPR